MSPVSLIPPRFVVLALDLDQPDDLALAPDQSIFFSDVGNGTVQRLDEEGKVTRIISGLAEPEGIVFLPDGTMLVAEQGKNRIVRFDLQTRKLTTFLQLENRTGGPGVDGIALDTKNSTVIIPDSPNGTLVRASRDGKEIQTIATGLKRPTGAALEADGSIIVAEENGNDLRRIKADGHSEVLARMPVPDDVLVNNRGDIYAVALGDGAVHLILANDGKDQIFFRGLSAPQGIAWAADNELVVADQGMHRIVKLITS